MTAKNINGEEYAYVYGNGRCFHRKGAGCAGEYTSDMTLSAAIEAARDPDDVRPCKRCLPDFVREHVRGRADGERGPSDPPAYREPYTDPDDARIRETYEREYYGLMYAGDYRWDNVKCTQEAYGDARASRGGGRNLRRSLKFYTEWMELSETIQCLKVIDQYNAFDAEYIADALGEIPGQTRFVVGRECSPVVYAWVHERDAQAALDAFEAAGSEDARRQTEIYEELKERVSDRDKRWQYMSRPELASGKTRELCEELKGLDTFAAAGPDELSVCEGGKWTPFDLDGANGETVEQIKQRYAEGELDDLELDNALAAALEREGAESEYVLIRAWWD